MTGRNGSVLVIAMACVCASLSAAWAGRQVFEFQVYTMGVEDADLVVSKVAGDDHTNLMEGLERMIKMRRAKLVGKLDFSRDAEDDFAVLSQKRTPVGSNVELLGKDVPALEISAASTEKNGYVELRYELACTRINSRGKACQLQWATTMAPPLDKWFVAIRSDLMGESTLCLAKVQSDSREVEPAGNFARVNLEVYEVQARQFDEISMMINRAKPEAYSTLKKIGKKVTDSSFAAGWGGHDRTQRFIHSIPYTVQKQKRGKNWKIGDRVPTEDVRVDSAGLGVCLWYLYADAESGKYVCSTQTNYSDPLSQENASESGLPMTSYFNNEARWSLHTMLNKRVAAYRVTREGKVPSPPSMDGESLSFPVVAVGHALTASPVMNEKTKYEGLNWRRYEEDQPDPRLRKPKKPMMPLENVLKDYLEMEMNTVMTLDPSSCVLTIKDNPEAVKTVKRFLKKNGHKF